MVAVSFSHMVNKYVQYRLHVPNGRQHEHRSEGSICFSCFYLSGSERASGRVPARDNKDDDETEDATAVDELICLFVCSVLEMRTFYFYCDSLLWLNSSCCLRSAINHSSFSYRNDLNRCLRTRTNVREHARWPFFAG